MKMKRTHTCGELRREHAGRAATLNGWVARVRDHGGVLFADLRDRYGVTQVRFSPELEASDALRSEAVLAVSGQVVERPADAVNSNRETGEIELRAERFELLNRAKTPPFEVTDVVEAREETRLKYRYVDMRRRPLSDAMVFRSRMCQIIREVFHAASFVEVETPLLMKTSPEGARDFIVPSRLHPGQVYAMPQSPQLLKQTLMCSGLDRYFQICKCLRDEDLRADRQPEFTQLDMEMSFVDRDDVFAIIERTVSRLYRDLKGIELTTPFPKLSYQETMERYGIDKPDTRFGLELVDCSDIAASAGFKVFSGAVAAGGSVRAINVPGGADLPRKQIDRLEPVAKDYGAKGLAWLKVLAGDFQGPVAKFLTDDEKARLVERTGASTGSLLLFVADQDPVVFAALAHVRLVLGRDLELIDQSRTDCLWVLDFPLFEYDKDLGAWTAMHHMFTSPKQPLPAPGQDLAGIFGNQYDLVMNGNEMGSGSIRIHDPEVQRQVFELIGMSREEADEKFGWFLRALEYGAPPHGGIALGVDRLAMVMLGYDNIRDVIAFPKNSSGVCPLMDTPSAPIGDALEVLGLEIKKTARPSSTADAGT